MKFVETNVNSFSGFLSFSERKKSVGARMYVGVCALIRICSPISDAIP